MMEPPGEINAIECSTNDLMRAARAAALKNNQIKESNFDAIEPTQSFAVMPDIRASTFAKNCTFEVRLPFICVRVMRLVSSLRA